LKNAKVIWFAEAKSVTTLRAGWMKSSAHLQTTSKTNSRRIFLRVSMRKHSIVNSLRVAKSLRLTPKICLSMLLKPITIASSGKIFTLCPTKPVTGKWWWEVLDYKDSARIYMTRLETSNWVTKRSKFSRLGSLCLWLSLEHSKHLYQTTAQAQSKIWTTLNSTLWTQKFTATTKL
jgi:hypothetical protein